jgi:hypothetical protein
MRRGYWTSAGQTRRGLGPRKKVPVPRDPCPECGQRLVKATLISTDVPTCGTCRNDLPNPSRKGDCPDGDGTGGGKQDAPEVLIINGSSYVGEKKEKANESR